MGPRSDHYMPDPAQIYSDVRTDTELDFGYASSAENYSYYHVLSKEGMIQLMNQIQTYDRWGYLNTCADWSSATFRDATGINVSANEWWRAGTPRHISESIIKLGVNTPKSPSQNAPQGSLH